MRVATDRRVVVADPGTTVDVVVDVVNTGDLIDGVTARLVGLTGAVVRTEPMVLPLFPGAAGQITVSVDVPASQPAGLHPVTVEVVSHVSGTTAQHVDLDLSVSARPGVRLTRDPALIRSKRTGRFVLAVENTGNVALDTALTATAPEKVTTRFAGAAHRVEPGSVVPVLLQVKGPRMVTGTEADRGVTVDLVAHRAHTIPAMDDAEPEQELLDQTSVTLRQRPLISRGFLTFLILAAIVAVWAAIFLLGLVQVFRGDPMTKTAPTSYFPASLTSQGTGASPSAGAAGTGGTAGAGGAASASTTAAPAGSTPKTGLLAPGVGGEIDGIVTAASNHAPVGRITVVAWRMGRSGPVQVSSAATQSDGSFALAGLFPTTYWLQFTADGYAPVWYPGKPAGRIRTTVSTASGSDQVMLTSAGGLSVGAQAKIEGTDVVMHGKPARISGQIDAGDTTETPKVTVTATMVDGGGASARPHTVTTDAQGRYQLTGLTAPGTYELAFSAPGYQVTTQVEKVDGGENRLEPTMLLGAQQGELTGTVTDGSRPLGGVTVSTTVAGKQVSVVTPTVGAVGTFTLGGLPTPGTYVITYSAPGHGSTTRIVAIAPGGDGSGDAVMTDGTGSVSGHLDDARGHGVGGATVTVGGVSGQPPTTTTLTSGDVGAFTLTGLAAGGNYTLTFTAAGYQPVTVPVTLTTDTPVTDLRATVVNPQVSLYGEVTSGGKALQGATVVVSDGVHVWQTTSTGAGGNLPAAIARTGGYYFPAIDPGVYNVTVSADGVRQSTTRIDLTAVPGDPPTRQQNLQVQAAGS